jgi:hypothetical protein
MNNTMNNMISKNNIDVWNMINQKLIELTVSTKLRNGWERTHEILKYVVCSLDILDINMVLKPGTETRMINNLSKYIAIYGKPSDNKRILKRSMKEKFMVFYRTMPDVCEHSVF